MQMILESWCLRLMWIFSSILCPMCQIVSRVEKRFRIPHGSWEHWGFGIRFPGPVESWLYTLKCLSPFFPTEKRHRLFFCKINIRICIIAQLWLPGIENEFYVIIKMDILWLLGVFHLVSGSLNRVVITPYNRICVKKNTKTLASFCCVFWLKAAKPLDHWLHFHWSCAKTISNWFGTSWLCGGCFWNLWGVWLRLAPLSVCYSAIGGMMTSFSLMVLGVFVDEAHAWLALRWRGRCDSWLRFFTEFQRVPRRWQWCQRWIRPMARHHFV